MVESCHVEPPRGVVACILRVCLVMGEINGRAVAPRFVARYAAKEEGKESGDDRQKVGLTLLCLRR